MTGGWEGDVLGLFLGRQKRRAFDQDTSCKCIKIIEQTQEYYRKQELDQKKAVSNRMETVVLTASATVTTREETSWSGWVSNLPTREQAKEIGGIILV